MNENITSPKEAGRAEFPLGEHQPLISFKEQRNLALQAIDLMEKSSPSSETNLQIGTAWYPGLPVHDRRRYGGFIAMAINGLQRTLGARQLLGGPALCADTCRLVVADVITSAYQRSKDFGYLAKIIEGWYPLAGGDLLGEIGPKEPPQPDFHPAYRIKPTTAEAPKRFDLEKVLGGCFGSNLREAYATLYAVIHGTIWLRDADYGDTEKKPGGVDALQNALYNFSNVIDPLFKGEVEMKGED